MATYQMKRWLIVDGPSKCDLMLALFDGDCYHCRRPLTFSLEDPEPEPMAPKSVDLPFVIEEIGRKDGSGENWNFKGVYVSNQKCLAQGFFSTRTRKGWIEF